MIGRFRAWWSTAHSSLIVHRTMKWAWVCLWAVSEFTGWITDVAFVSRLSLVALILGSWSAEEAAKVEAHQEDTT